MTVTLAAIAEQATTPALGLPVEGVETRFGRFPIDPDRLIHFAMGLPGFPDRHRFQLERIAGVSIDLLLLQCMDDAELGFFVTPLPDGSPLLRAADRAWACRLIDVDPKDTDFLLIVTVRRGPAGLELHANLRAPILIDAARRAGMQIVLPDASYSLRHRIVVPS